MGCDMEPNRRSSRLYTTQSVTTRHYPIHCPGNPTSFCSWHAAFFETERLVVSIDTKFHWRFGVSEIHRKALFFEEIVLKRGSDSLKTHPACKLGSLSTQKLVPSAASFPLTKCGVPLDMCNMILRSELLFCFKKCSGLSKKKRNLHPYKGMYILLEMCF